MKREADTHAGIQTSPQKRHRQGDEELRFLIPSRVAGSIIGRGGQNIAKLRGQYKASITIPDCYGPERVLTISADLDTAFQILNDIIPKLEESGQRDPDGNEIELRMLVHQSQAGCIIGKGGLKIKELREKTGTRIKIYSNCCPHSTDRLISICGKPDIVIDCIQQLITAIKSSPIKGISNPYDPRNYDEFFADEYGGFGEGQGGKTHNSPGFSGLNIRGNVPSGNTNISIPRMRDNRNTSPAGLLPNRNTYPPSVIRGAGSRPNTMSFSNSAGISGGYPSERQFTGNNIRQNTMSENFGSERSSSFMNNRSGQMTFPSRNFNDPNWNMPMVNNSNGLSNNANPGVTNFSVNSNQPSQTSANGNITSTQVTIPKDLAGAIIGKGGARIRKIRLDSGASITIDMPLPGSSDRIITITGIPSQIQMAQFLLQQSVHENADTQYKI